jgi:ornithine cyclodeaminase/alanine dehydrogenase-like protein (mu-crystallin family)
VTLILDADAVSSVISMPLAIDAMHEAFVLEGKGLAGRVARVDMSVDRGWLRLQSAAIEGLGLFGFKAMNLNRDVGVRYQVHLYDSSSGELLAIVDGAAITSARTAGSAAVATRLMVDTAPEAIAMIGTGYEARAQLEAMRYLFPDARFQAYSRSELHRSLFADEMGELTGATVVAHACLEDAIDGARIVVLATKSAEPVLRAEHVSGKRHITSIGATRLDQYELAPEVFALCEAIVCDSTELVLREAGDAVDAVRRGMLQPGTPRDLATLIAADARPGAWAAGVTLFKSVGTAIQDVVLAARVLSAARKHSLGQTLSGFPRVKPI